VAAARNLQTLQNPTRSIAVSMYFQRRNPEGVADAMSQQKRRATARLFE
jgi:hypothetical protein